MRHRNDTMMRNGEGYYDPTAGAALQNVMKQTTGKYVSWPGQLIYICTDSPTMSYADVQQLENLCIYATEQGAHPVAPLLFYSELYDLRDRVQRAHVQRLTRSWFRQCSEVWIIGDHRPYGLRKELMRAMRKGKTIRHFWENSKGEIYQTSAHIGAMDGGRQHEERVF